MKQAVSVVLAVAASGLGSSVARAAGCPWVCKNYYVPDGLVAIPLPDNRIWTQSRAAIFLFPDQGYTGISRSATALAFAATQYPAPTGVLFSGGISIGSVGFADVLQASATADAAPLGVVLNICFSQARGAHSAAARSQVAYPPAPVIAVGQLADPPEIVICGHGGLSSLTVDEDDFLVGTSLARASAGMEVSYTGVEQPSYAAEAVIAPEFDLPVNGVLRTVLSLRIPGQITDFAVYSSQSGNRASAGLVESAGVYLLNVSGPIQRDIVQEFGLDEIRFSDAQFDVDGDGRFSASDVSALALLVGSSDPGVIARFDFDNDDAITQSDELFVQGLVDRGLDSGFFGDANRDGVVDCQDRFGLSLSGLVIADPSYTITMDLDLDGDIDAVDIAAADPLIPTADVNRDGGINGSDVEEFFVLFAAGDIGADLNQSGGIEGGDVGAFFTLFQLGC